SYVYRPRGAGMLTTPRLIVIALCAALNFSIGTIVYLVKLPIYLDSIGTILCALLLASDRKVAFVCAWLAATVSTIISVLINPFIPWFALTDMTLALVSAFATSAAVASFRARPMRTGAFIGSVVLYGVLTGIAAGIVSALIVAYVFGGVTGSGSAAIVALYLRLGLPGGTASLLFRTAPRAGGQAAAGDAGRPALSGHAARVRGHAAGADAGRGSTMTPNGAIVLAAVLVGGAMLTRDLVGLAALSLFCLGFGAIELR